MPVSGGHVCRGYLYEASGSFYVRYCTGMTVSGNPMLVLKSHRLWDKNNKYYSTKPKAVKLPRRVHAHG
jgi:hypothetical protein